MATKTKPIDTMDAPRKTKTKGSVSLFKPVYIDQRVSLTPIELRKAAEDIDKFLVEKMRKRLEGVCCSHGYVRPGSTEILARSMGQAEHGRFTADFIFNCKVRIGCFLPFADQIITVRILKMNKLGAYALVYDEGRVSEAMRVLVPRDLHLGSEEFDGLKEGQGIKVRLLRSRFQVNDTFIQAVGKYEGRVPAADRKERAPEAEAEAPMPEEEEEEEMPVEGEAESKEDEVPIRGVEGVPESKGEE